MIVSQSMRWVSQSFTLSDFYKVDPSIVEMYEPAGESHMRRWKPVALSCIDEVVAIVAQKLFANVCSIKYAEKITNIAMFTTKCVSFHVSQDSV